VLRFICAGGTVNANAGEKGGLSVRLEDFAILLSESLKRIGRDVRPALVRQFLRKHHIVGIAVELPHGELMWSEDMFERSPRAEFNNPTNDPRLSGEYVKAPKHQKGPHSYKGLT
jgi:hypothetical protein